MPPKPDQDDRVSEAFWMWRGYHMAGTLHALEVANQADRERFRRPEPSGCAYRHKSTSRGYR